jgi:hypothetical protein
MMEHIPTDRVNYVIRKIMTCTEEAFFQISTVPDVMGALIGQELHLTVKPFEWWLGVFHGLGYRVKWSEKQDIAALFFISNYA